MTIFIIICLSHIVKKIIDIHAYKYNNNILVSVVFGVDGSVFGRVSGCGEVGFLWSSLYIQKQTRNSQPLPETQNRNQDNYNVKNKIICLKVP